MQSQITVTLRYSNMVLIAFAELHRINRTHPSTTGQALGGLGRVAGTGSVAYGARLEPEPKMICRDKATSTSSYVHSPKTQDSNSSRGRPCFV